MPYTKTMRAITTMAVTLLTTLLLVACGGTDPENLIFQLEVKERALVNGETPIQVQQGDTVVLDVAMDEALTFHLHGYDIEVQGAPGDPALLTLVADATGSFPFTVHSSDEHDAHGGIFQSGELGRGDSFAYQVPQDMSSMPIDYHSHLHAEVQGVIMVSDDAPEGDQIDVTIEDLAVYPAMVMVRPGTMVVWTNQGIEVHILVTGEHPDATMDGSMDEMKGMDHEEKEIELGRLEVLPR
jgi:plastocyanin